MSTPTSHDAQPAGPDETRPCSACGTPMRRFARFCRACGARYDVSVRGYCAACHDLTEAGADGKCGQCGAELADPQVEHRLLAAGRPPAAPPSPAAERPRALICARCKSENPPAAGRCRSCGADLLPAEGAGQRLAYLASGLVGAALLGFLFYEFHIRNPGSGPDIALCNPAALGVGAVAALGFGLVMALRRTPAYVRYENRSARHADLSPAQALDDLERALELAPQKEQARLTKRRAALYEKLGRADEAARDHLALATSPDAFKGEGEWVAALTGADGGTYVHSRRTSQINALLQSGQARAVGYCPRCRDAVELDGRQRCPEHPKVKGREVQYVIPADLFAGKLAVLQRLEGSNRQAADRLTELLGSGQAQAVGWCRRCKAAVELDAGRRCPRHPRVKGQRVQYVVPGGLEAGRRAALQGQPRIESRTRLRAVGLILVAAATALLVLNAFGDEIAEFVRGVLSGG